MSVPTNGRLQLILAVVVSIGWLAVLLVPAITKLELKGEVSMGAQAAMMLILGAIFGRRILQRGKDES